MDNRDQHSLASCIIMDLIGCASYFIPGIGEGFDLVWGVIAGIVFRNWFHSNLGAIGAAIEELAPFTDIIPSFTIGYFITKDKSKPKELEP